ncbi:hypothetical protein SERLADRAFT_397321 [Serpula lacrymans var. lacrymans S7.9]|uniref:Uncharacterized protein n=1 Tax=Serpula lacrymans var. lacrymans (strain S7.9) TaxID=578457 RepID=F8P5F5_SERL9|nr:uncharacterized protein SERLADRAFT_397321 [Serpula lacrymans var. lacrymans S7.9]EGO21842.1 hypothetical protein SERLADRAFT_397321 [Serpula lacrymans var. lacrymans S7.9]
MAARRWRIKGCGGWTVSGIARFEWLKGGNEIDVLREVDVLVVVSGRGPPPDGEFH